MRGGFKFRPRPPPSESGGHVVWLRSFPPSLLWFRLQWWRSLPPGGPARAGVGALSLPLPGPSPGGGGSARPGGVGGGAGLHGGPLAVARTRGGLSRSVVTASESGSLRGRRGGAGSSLSQVRAGGNGSRQLSLRPEWSNRCDWSGSIYSESEIRIQLSIRLFSSCDPLRVGTEQNLGRH